MRKISVILALITASVLIGCGEVKATNDLLDNNANANIETPSEPIEEVVTDEKNTVEDSTIPEKKTEEVAAEVEEEKPVFEGLTEEWALEKLGLAKTAYKELTDHMDKPAESNALYDFFTNKVYSMDLQTKDGVVLNAKSDDEFHTTGGIYEGVCAYYFDNFINNDGEYFDFADYISSHTSDEINFYNAGKNLACNTNDNYMRNLIWCESLFGTLSVRNISNEVTVDHKSIKMPNEELIDAAYQCDIYMEDKYTGLKMLFDVDGNLLNLNDEEYNNQIEFVMPFEQ